LDLWLDLELVYDQIKRCTYRPKVSVSEHIKSNRRSTYLGSKGLKRAVFYEKPLTKNINLDLKRSRS